MDCCVCAARAVVSFGFDQTMAERYCGGLRTYVASGSHPIILTFCAVHAERAAVTWPGLIAQPVQAVPRHWREGQAAIAAIRQRLADPKASFLAYQLWRRERRRRHPTRLWRGLRDRLAAEASISPLNRRAGSP
ncbi:MAG: hypothetical protein OHK0024_15790 [Thalassobaculales bacterium]